MQDRELNNLLQRAEALMKSNWIHAVQLLAQAADEHPEDPRPLIALGEFYQRRQIYSKAIKCYQSALKLLPDDNHLKMVIGSIYFAEGEYELAIVYYDKIENPHPDARYNKALALAYLGRHEESIEIMRQLLDLIDNNPFIYFLLIEQLLRIGEYSSAMEYIDRAEKQIGLHKHLLLLKAIGYAHRQNWLLAYHAFRTYEKTGDNIQSEYLRLYADAAIKSGMAENAIPILKKGIDSNPYDMGLYEELIRVLIKQKDMIQARKYMRQAKRFFPMLSPLLQLMQARMGKTTD